MKTKSKAFTLMETVVTIVIYAIMLLMITNIVLLNARLSQQLKVRSRIRSEMSQMMSLIKRDIRNAVSIPDTLGNCDNVSTRYQQTGGSTASCSMNLSGQTVVWTWKNNRLSKTITVSGKTTEEYVTGDFLNIDSVNFTMIPGTDSLDKRVTIILTIKASGTNSAWKVSNQLVQEIISTRNYELGI